MSLTAGHAGPAEATPGVAGGWRGALRDLVVIFDPVRRPRQFGAALASVTFVLFSVSSGASWAAAGAIAAVWVLGVVVGAYYRVLVDRFVFGIALPLIRGSWSGALVGGLTGAWLAWLLVGRGVSLDVLAAGLTLCIAVLYVFCKLGCLSQGCCGWSLQFERFRRWYPLQRVEVALAVLGLAVTAALLAAGESFVAIPLFLTIHGAQRLLSRAGRGSPFLKGLVAPDGAPMICVAVVLTVGTAGFG